MPSIGSFGTARPALDLDFEWCGEATIRVHPQASDLGFTEFMARANNVDLPDDVEDMSPAEMAAVLNSMTAVTTAVYQLMRDLIHPEDWDLFWSLAKKHGQQNADLMQLSRDIQMVVTEAQSGFPTGPPSGSSGSPSNTGPRSSASGPSRRDRRALARTNTRTEDRAHRRQVREQVVERAMDELSGRPDLKMALIRSQVPEETLTTTLTSALGPPSSAD